MERADESAAFAVSLGCYRAGVDHAEIRSFSGDNAADAFFGHQLRNASGFREIEFAA